MTRARLYVDEDSMSRSLVRALRARGVDVMTALDEHMIERSDAEHLQHGTAAGRVLFTFNVGDFLRLHEAVLARGERHTGIYRLSPATLLRRRTNAAPASSARGEIGRGHGQPGRVPQSLGRQPAVARV